MVEQHQREQPTRLRLLGGEGELAGEPDRLAGQVDPARVTGRVDQVEHAQHDREVAGLVQGAPAQAALGSADPLRHRRLRDVEGVGDLPRGQAADRAQGERHLRGRRQLGMAAGEEQEEGVVAGVGTRAAARAPAIRAARPRGRDGRPRCGAHRSAAGSRPPTATHADRCGGCSGQTRSASISASCSASSAASKSSPRRTSPASTWGTRARSAPSSSRRVGSSITPRQSSEERSHMTSRTSIHSYIGSPPGPGSEET